MKPLTSDGSASQAEPGLTDVASSSNEDDRSHVRVRGEDPELDEAVEGVLADIHQRLAGDGEEPLISFEALEDDQLDDDEQPTRVHSTTLLPPPLPPERLAEAAEAEPSEAEPSEAEESDPDDSQRISVPEVLLQAIVYAPVSDDVDDVDEDEDPTRVVTAAVAIDELVMEPPPSLRPISRTSLPPYEEPSRRSWLMPSLLAAAAVVTLWLAWPKHHVVDAHLSESAVTVAVAVHQSVAKQGFQATSKAHDARVTVDGVDRGLLPVALDDLTVGVHRVRFSAPGHAPLERTVQVAAGRLLDLGSIELSAVAHRAYLSIDPPNAFAQIRAVGDTVGRRFAGPWPRYVDLGPGRYEVTAFRAGFRPVARQFEVKAGGALASLRIELSHEDIYED